MADFADMAAEREAIHRAESLARAGEKNPGYPALTHCQLCEEEIPEGRRRAVPGATLCIDCQEDYERVQ